MKKSFLIRRGQTTIPNRIRKKPNIREGTRLKEVAKDGKVIFSKMLSIFDLAGKSTLTKEQAFKRLDKMRH